MSLSVSDRIPDFSLDALPEAEAMIVTVKRAPCGQSIEVKWYNQGHVIRADSFQVVIDGFAASGAAG